MQPRLTGALDARAATVERHACISCHGRPMADHADTFQLWDLEVETVAGPGAMVCDHPPGVAFRVEGEALVMGPHGRFPIYALAALLPLLPAKQRPTDPNDWMSTDAEVACPDPHCAGRFRIRRAGLRTFRHAQTTGLPDRRETPYWDRAR